MAATDTLERRKVSLLSVLTQLIKSSTPSSSRRVCVYDAADLSATVLFSSSGSGLLEGLGCSVAKATAVITGASRWLPRLASDSLKRREVRGRGMGIGLGMAGLHGG